jgi:hypothetical protein
MNRESLTIVSELRVLTEASIWLIRPSTYLRLPRAEVPRPPIDDIDGATRDAVWHEHEGAWLLDSYGIASSMSSLPPDLWDLVTSSAVPSSRSLAVSARIHPVVVRQPCDATDGRCTGRRR